MKKKIFYNLPSNRGYYTHNGMRHYKIGTNYYREDKRDGLKMAVCLSLLLIISSILMFYACRK